MWSYNEIQLKTVYSFEELKEKYIKEPIYKKIVIAYIPCKEWETYNNCSTSNLKKIIDEVTEGFEIVKTNYNCDRDSNRYDLILTVKEKEDD